MDQQLNNRTSLVIYDFYTGFSVQWAVILHMYFLQFKPKAAFLYYVEKL